MLCAALRYALNDAGKAVKGSSILILGLAYKPNVDDERESPSYFLMEMLKARGAKVAYYDPYVSRDPTHPRTRAVDRNQIR